jgi:hypothetical protein
MTTHQTKFTLGALVARMPKIAKAPAAGRAATTLKMKHLALAKSKVKVAF